MSEASESVNPVCQDAPVLDTDRTILIEVGDSDSWSLHVHGDLTAAEVDRALDVALRHQKMNSHE